MAPSSQARTRRRATRAPLVGALGAALNVSGNIAEGGSRLARERLNSAPPPNPNIPLAEVLYWFSVIDEERAYPSRHSASHDGKTAAALIFIRNKVTHGGLVKPIEQWVPLEQTGRGGYGGVAYGSTPYAGTVSSWRWRTRAELGNPTDGKGGRDALYDQYVAGKDVPTPLDAAERFFGL
jgi:hypothetical protein